MKYNKNSDTYVYMTLQSLQSNTLHHRHCVKRLIERRVAVFKIAHNVTVNVTRSMFLKMN